LFFVMIAKLADTERDAMISDAARRSGMEGARRRALLENGA